MSQLALPTTHECLSRLKLSQLALWQGFAQRYEDALARQDYIDASVQGSMARKCHEDYIALCDVVDAMSIDLAQKPVDVEDYDLSRRN